MSSPEAIAALGGEPFCRFFALLGAHPHPAGDAASAAYVAQRLADEGRTALLLVEEGLAGAVIAAIGEEGRVTICPIPGPGGSADASRGALGEILATAIGSHLHEP